MLINHRRLKMKGKSKSTPTLFSAAALRVTSVGNQLSCTWYYAYDFFYAQSLCTMPLCTVFVNNYFDKNLSFFKHFIVVMLGVTDGCHARIMLSRSGLWGPPKLTNKIDDAKLCFELIIGELIINFYYNSAVQIQTDNPATVSKVNLLNWMYSQSTDAKARGGTVSSGSGNGAANAWQRRVERNSRRRNSVRRRPGRRVLCRPSCDEKPRRVGDVADQAVVVPSWDSVETVPGRRRVLQITNNTTLQLSDNVGSVVI